MHGERDIVFSQRQAAVYLVESSIKSRLQMGSFRNVDDITASLNGVLHEEYISLQSISCLGRTLKDLSGRETSAGVSGGLYLSRFAEEQGSKTDVCS